MTKLTCIKSKSCCRFAPDRTRETYSTPPDSLAGFQATGGCEAAEKGSGETSGKEEGYTP